MLLSSINNHCRKCFTQLSLSRTHLHTSFTPHICHSCEGAATLSFPKASIGNPFRTLRLQYHSGSTCYCSLNRHSSLSGIQTYVKQSPSTLRSRHLYLTNNHHGKLLTHRSTISIISSESRIGSSLCLSASVVNPHLLATCHLKLVTTSLLEIRHLTDRIDPFVDFIHRC